METRGFLISRTPDSIYFSQGNTREELHLVKRMFEEIGFEATIEDRKIHLNNPLTEEQLERIVWYPARNHEVGGDYRSGSWKYFAKRRHAAKVNTFVLEAGVARLVKAISAAGISTFCSCDGHGKRRPSIIFSGRIQAIWFDLLYQDVKGEMELNYDWKLNWNSSMGPSLMADRVSKTQRWNLQDILEDSMRIARFFLEHAEQISKIRREVFGKRLKTTKKMIKTMNEEELYKWMDEKYNQYKNAVKIENLATSKNSEH